MTVGHAAGVCPFDWAYGIDGHRGRGREMDVWAAQVLQDEVAEDGGDDLKGGVGMLGGGGWWDVGRRWR